jgi:hypothetical protein
MHILHRPYRPRAVILLPTKLLILVSFLLITFVPSTYIPWLCRVLLFLFFAFYFLAFATLFYILFGYRVLDSCRRGQLGLN